MSWCTCWKCHRCLPVLASIATIDAVKRLSPGRLLPSRSLDAFPVEKKISPRSGSTAGVCHTGPPPPRPPPALPPLRVVGPRLVTGLARPRDGVEAPALAAGRGAVGGDAPADTEL